MTQNRCSRWHQHRRLHMGN